MSDKTENDTAAYCPTIFEMLRTGILVCRVCKDVYTNPVLLPCLDTICYDCLANASKNIIVDSDPSAFNCPVCQAKTEFPVNGISEFKENTFISSLLEIYDCQQEEEKPCEYCDFDHKAVLATHRCLDCQDNMCDDCTNAHRRTKLTRSHQLAPFELIQMGRYDDNMREAQHLKCEIHEECSFSMFCNECNRLICQECKIADHDSHQWVSLQEAGKHAGKQIQVLLESTKGKVPGLVSYCDYLEKYSFQIEELKIKLTGGIENHTEMLHRMLDKYKDDILQELSMVTIQERDKVDEKKNKLDNIVTSMKGGSEFLAKLLSYGKDDEILFLSKQIVDRLSALVYMQLEGLSHKIGLFFKQGSINGDGMQSIFGYLDKCEIPLGKSDLTSFSTDDLVASSVLPDVSKVEIISSFEAKSMYDEKDIWPTGLAMGPKGQMVVLDRENRRVKFFNENGEYLHDFGAKEKNPLGCPFDVAFLQNGNLAISDYLDEDVKIYQPKGKFVMCIQKHFKHPRGVAVNNAGSIIVVDCGFRRLTMHNADSGIMINTIGGVDEDDNEIFTDPYYVAVTSSDCMIVTDWAAPNIKVFNPKGEYIAKYGTYGIRQDECLQPYGVCTDGFGYIFVADHSNHRIHLLLPDGRFQKFVVTKKDGLWHPMAVAINNKGQLVVTESLGKVKVFKYL